MREETSLDQSNEKRWAELVKAHEASGQSQRYRYLPLLNATEPPLRYPFFDPFLLSLAK